MTVPAAVRFTAPDLDAIAEALGARRRHRDPGWQARSRRAAGQPPHPWRARAAVEGGALDAKTAGR